MRLLDQHLGGLGRLFVFLTLVGCSEAPSEPTTWPMRPLVYTENPDLTPESAEVDEARLMRRLLSGAEGSKWGTMPPVPTDLPVLNTPEALGRTMTMALLTRNQTLWEHTFVPAADYAELIRMEEKPAQAFVDGLVAKSRGIWDLFEVPVASEARPEGWPSLFEFVELLPGDPRKLDGKPATKPEETAQYWNGKLTLRYIPGNTTFELPISKILKVVGQDGDRFYLGAPALADTRLRVLIGAGVHLKPELMRPEEFPYPMQVGSFWRYSRFPEGRENDVLDPAMMATAVVVEVVSVDRFDTVRLVRLRRSYNDANLTKVDEWWVTTPRRIYICDRGCRQNVENLGWLLNYFSGQAPIYVFPLQPDESWGAGGYRGQTSTFKTSVGAAMELPGGVFRTTMRIEGQGALGVWDTTLSYPQERVFSWGKGLVQRRLKTPDGVIVESLSEYRLMPSN